MIVLLPKSLRRGNLDKIAMNVGGVHPVIDHAEEPEGIKEPRR
jgi:hypothetical protein